MNNVHNQAIPAETLAVAQKKIDEVKELLSPYLTNLTAAQRHEMAKMGDKTVAFVSKAFELAGQNPALCPGYMDMAAFGVDMADATKLLVIENSLQQLLHAIDDTSMVAGSEAYHSALVFYNTVKEAASKNINGAKAVFEDLKSRFPHIQRKQKTV